MHLAQFGRGDVANDRDACSRRTSWGVLSQGRKIASIPSVSEYPRQNISLALHDPERSGKLGFDDEQTLVIDPCVDRFLYHRGAGAFSLFHELGYRVADLPDDAFATGEPGVQPAPCPFIIDATK